MMNRRTSSIHTLHALFLVSLAGLSGCWEGAPDSTTTLSEAPPVRNPATLVKFLPDGATFKSPIIADKILGSNTRTLEEALGRLQVIARDGALYDGIGREIKFLNAPKSKTKDRDFEKTLSKMRAKYCVLLLAE